jgi:Xaa-Pro aminopeptidase
MQRLERLYQHLVEENIDCLVVTKPVNLFYLLGLEVSVGMLVVLQGSYTLYLDSRYTQEALDKGLKVMDAPLSERFSFFSNVHIEGDFVTLNQFFDWKKLYPNTNFHSANAVEKLRIIKDENEIAFLKEAGRKTALMMDVVMQHLTEGITELELESLIANPSFRPIIAFGSNAAHIHHRPEHRRYKKNETALFDLGVKHEGYMGDMTRTLFSSVASRVEEAHYEALKHLKAGVTLKELDAVVKQKIPFKDHSLSHGIGLEVHERPLFKNDGDMILLPGMVITIEPGLYIPHETGARFENMVLVCENGWEILTKI